jgi:hypothetical protein
VRAIRSHPPNDWSPGSGGSARARATAQSELAMAHRAHSHITLFKGGSHLTLVSNPQAVTNVILSAVCSLG